MDGFINNPFSFLHEVGSFTSLNYLWWISGIGMYAFELGWTTIKTGD